MKTVAALALSISVAACSGPDTTAQDLLSCTRDAPGQLECLVDFFDAPACKEAQPLGAMHRENAKADTHQTITAFDVSAECRAELISNARALGFVQGATDSELTLELSETYRQTLTLSENTVVEWERTKK